MFRGKPPKNILKRSVQYRERQPRPEAARQRKSKVNPAFRRFVKRLIAENSAELHASAESIADAIVGRATFGYGNSVPHEAFILNALPANLSPEIRKKLETQIIFRLGKQEKSRSE